MTILRKLMVGGLAGLLGLLLAVQPVAAAGGSLTIPVSTIKRGEPGSTHVLATQAVDQDLIGMVCDVKATGENQSSVHPGNDIVITSGNGEVTLADVERAPNVVTTADGQLTLSDQILVTLVLGSDGVFSGGMNLEFDCAEPEEPKTIEVCRDGKIITIKAEDRLDTDTDACVLSDEDLPEVLPNTGLGGLASGAMGAGAIGLSVRSWLESRSMLRSGVKKEL